ncbi:hypothetical protein [Gordonia soli]|nr:hypothetical protein [Gordonia soli]
MSVVAEALADLARRYQRMHTIMAAADEGRVAEALTAATPHVSVSPLAVWAQLALIGDAVGARSGEVAPATSDAAELVRGVLAHPHPACTVGATIWLPFRSVDDRQRLEMLADSLREQGHWAGPGMPRLEDLDAWTADHTGGAIGQFPVDLAPGLFHIPSDWETGGAEPDSTPGLVTAIAFQTGGHWPAPLEVVPAGELAAPWSISHALRVSGPECGLAWDTEVGLVGVAVNRSGNGMFTVSAIADPGCREAEVTGAATRITRRFAAGERVLLRGNELPVGDGGWWRVSDSPLYRGGLMEQQHNAALLPIWQSIDVHDLMAMGLGYWNVMQESMLPQLADAFDHAVAQHVSVLRFDNLGFGAAAVAAAGAVRGGWVSALYADHITEPVDLGPLPAFDGGGTLVELDFRHPFAAVVATASEHGGSFWQGLPLHVAWVVEADPQVPDTRPSGYLEDW